MRVNKVVIKKNLAQLSAILKMMIPEGKDEKKIFFILFFCYSCLSFFFSLGSSILDHPVNIIDAYFSFDNGLILIRGYQNLDGHPFLEIFSKPFIWIGDLLIFLLGIKAKTLFFSLLSSLFITLSCVYVFRYLSRIVNIGRFSAHVFTLFYACFSTNLILCFTPESFTVSAFLLTFTLYVYSLYVREEKRMYFLSHSFFLIGLGGVTITNYVKGMLCMAFTKEKWLSLFYKLVIISSFFCAQLLIIDFYGLLRRRVHLFWAHPDDLPFISKVLSFFFGGPILFSDLDYIANPWFPTFSMISVSVYDSWFQYLFVILLLLGIVWAAIRNVKNKLVQMLALVFLVDIGLHVVLRLGLNEAFIYGGHWVFVVPLFLGWLYSSLRGNQRKMMLGVTIGLWIVLCINNTYQMVEFINLSLTHYPVSASYP